MLNEGLTWRLALIFHRGAGAQSGAAPRGGAARAAEAGARGPDGGQLTARSVGEAQLPGACALHVPGPLAPGRQAAPAGHTRQQVPGGPCREKGTELRWAPPDGGPTQSSDRGGVRRLALPPPHLARPRYLFSSPENGSYPLAKL